MVEATNAERHLRAAARQMVRLEAADTLESKADMWVYLIYELRKVFEALHQSDNEAAPDTIGQAQDCLYDRRWKSDEVFIFIQEVRRQDFHYSEQPLKPGGRGLLLSPSGGLLKSGKGLLLSPPQYIVVDKEPFLNMKVDDCGRRCLEWTTQQLGRATRLAKRIART
jgi:hypothetical protein